MLNQLSGALADQLAAKSGFYWPLFLLGRALYCFLGLGREFLGGLEGQTVARVAAGFSFDQLAYWPYYGLVWLVDLLVSDSLLAARLVSGLLAWLTLINFWLIVGHFHRSYFALAGLVFLLVNSWFLQLGQTANPEIFSLALLSGGIAWLGFYSAPPKQIFIRGRTLSGFVFRFFFALDLLVAGSSLGFGFEILFQTADILAFVGLFSS